MSIPKHVESEDLMLYAMQLLGPGEAAAIEAHLDQSASSRRELADIRGDLAIFALTAESVTPSAQSRTRFLKQIDEEPRAAARSQRPQAESTPEAGVTSIGTYRAERQQPPKAPVGIAARVFPWAGWAVAAGMAFTAGEFYRERQTLRETVATNQRQSAATDAQAESAREVLSAMNDQTAKRVTLTRAGAPVSPTGRTTYSAAKGVLIFTASNLDPVDTFKVYELWLIPANGGAPIPAGTFHPDANGYANLISTEMPKGVEAKAFGITVEDDGGSKVPTLPILLAGT